MVLVDLVFYQVEVCKPICYNIREIHHFKKNLLTALVLFPLGIRYPTGAGVGQGALKPGKGLTNFH